MYICMQQQLMEKEAMNFKERKERYMKDLEEQKGRGNDAIKL